MRKIIINGRIASDAEVKTDKTGRQFVRFRFANNEFSDPKDQQGKPITYWFSVMSYEPRCLSIQKYLKKGRPINIIGAYSDGIYQNKNTGAFEISHNILAESIDFEVGRPIEEGNGTQGTYHQPQQSTYPTQNTSEIPKTQTSMGGFNPAVAQPTPVQPNTGANTIPNTANMAQPLQKPNTYQQAASQAMPTINVMPQVPNDPLSAGNADEDDLPF